MLDFVQRVEGLSLPEVIRPAGRRRWESNPGLPVGAGLRSSRTARPPCPPAGPGLLTAAARFYAGQLCLSTRSAGVPGFHGRQVRSRHPGWDLAHAGPRATRSFQSAMRLLSKRKLRGIVAGEALSKALSWCHTTLAPWGYLRTAEMLS